MGNILTHLKLFVEALTEDLSGAYAQLKKHSRLTRSQFRRRWRKFRNWISQPRNRWLVVAGGSALTFVVIYFGIPALGFGTAGISANSWAAAHQSAAYAGLTPAGGWFATMTSIGMTGAAPWVASACSMISIPITWFGAWLLGSPKALP